jgi:nicotinamidase/pyrazinamidase
MTAVKLDPTHDVLGVIDVQPTFMPGGELPVPEGDRVLGPVNRLLDLFRHAFATQDWHPLGHLSFASSHPGKRPFETILLPYGEQTLWPDHAVQETPGAALHPALRQGPIELVVRKGFRREIDSYSAFFENDRKTSTALADWLRARGFRRLFFAGLALDFCVAFSAEDAARLGFESYVVLDACRAVGLPLGGGTTLDAARARMAAAGVRFLTLAELTS